MRMRVPTNVGLPWRIARSATLYYGADDLAHPGVSPPPHPRDACPACRQAGPRLWQSGTAGSGCRACGPACILSPFNLYDEVMEPCIKRALLNEIPFAIL